MVFLTSSISNAPIPDWTKEIAEDVLPLERYVHLIEKNKRNLR